MSEKFISRFVEETPLSGLLANSRWMVSQKLPSFTGNGLPDLFKKYSTILDDYHNQSVEEMISVDKSGILTSNATVMKLARNMPYDEMLEVEHGETIERRKIMVNNYGLKMNQLLVTIEFKDILIETQLDEIVYLRRNGRKEAEERKDREMAHQEEMERLRKLLEQKQNRIQDLEEENQILREENEDEVAYSRELEDRIDEMTAQAKKGSEELKEMSEDLLECQTQCFHYASEAQQYVDELEKIKMKSFKSRLSRFLRILTNPSRWCHPFSTERHRGNQ